MQYIKDKQHFYMDDGTAYFGETLQIVHFFKYIGKTLTFCLE